MSTPDYKALAAEAAREVKLRERVYARRVAEGRMTTADMRERIDRMRQIQAVLEDLDAQHRATITPELF